MKIEELETIIQRMHQGEFASFRRSGEKINVNEAIKIAAALKESTTLTTLDLSCNALCDECAIAIAKALQHNTTLTTLILGANQIGDSGATAIAKALQHNTTLASFDLRINQIGDSGATAIASALQHNTTLTTLILNTNQIGDSGATHFAKALQHNTTLTALKIRDNKIRAEGVSAIAAALQHNTTLTTLDLSCNLIGDDGVIDIVHALERNTTLTMLGLELIKFGDKALNVFVNILKYNTTLTMLSISLRSHVDAKVFAEILRYNRTLTTLNFGWTGLFFTRVTDDEGDRAIAEALETNTTLTSIVGYNSVDFEINEWIMDLLKRNRDMHAKVEELREIYMGDPHTYMDWLHTYPESTPKPQQALEGTSPFELSQNKHLFWRIDQNQASLFEWIPPDTMQKLHDFQKALYTSPIKPRK